MPALRNTYFENCISLVAKFLLELWNYLHYELASFSVENWNLKILQNHRCLARRNFFQHWIHRVATAAFWHTYSIMMEKLAQAGEGGGLLAHPLSLYLPSRTKLQCTLQLRGQIHSPYFIYIPVYSVVEFYPLESTHNCLYKFTSAIHVYFYMLQQPTYMRRCNVNPSQNYVSLNGFG